MDLLSHGSQCKPAKFSSFHNKLNACIVNVIWTTLSVLSFKTYYWRCYSRLNSSRPIPSAEHAVVCLGAAQLGSEGHLDNGHPHAGDEQNNFPMPPTVSGDVLHAVTPHLCVIMRAVLSSALLRTQVVSDTEAEAAWDSTTPALKLAWGSSVKLGWPQPPSLLVAPGAYWKAVIASSFALGLSKSHFQLQAQPVPIPHYPGHCSSSLERQNCIFLFRCGWAEPALTQWRFLGAIQLFEESKP